MEQACSGMLEDDASLEQVVNDPAMPNFREGLQWEATQVLLLDYCNYAEGDPCQMKNGVPGSLNGVVKRLIEMGSPELFRSHYDQQLGKVGYLYKQTRGTPVFLGSGAKLPKNGSDISVTPPVGVKSSVDIFGHSTLE